MTAEPCGSIELWPSKYTFVQEVGKGESPGLEHAPMARMAFAALALLIEGQQVHLECLRGPQAPLDALCWRGTARLASSWP